MYSPLSIRLEGQPVNNLTPIRTIDMSTVLSVESEPELVANQIMFEHSEITENLRKKLVDAISQLLEHMSTEEHKFEEGKTCYTLKSKFKAHGLPGCDILLNIPGDILITSSYEKLVKFWNTNNNEMIVELSGHSNVVYKLALNSPLENKLATCSFDRSVKLWEFPSGSLISTLTAHIYEVVAIAFNPSGNLLGSCGMDSKAIIWDVDTSNIIHNLEGHTAEVVACCFNNDSSLFLTCSFDCSAKIWNVITGDLLFNLTNHSAEDFRLNPEVTQVGFNLDNSLCFSTSVDHSIILWNTNTGELVHIFSDFIDEAIDAKFAIVDSKELLIASSACGEVHVYDVHEKCTKYQLKSHQSEVSKVLFNKNSNHFITLSSDKTVKIWCARTGELLQTLEVHDDEIFSASLNKNGTKLATCDKDGYVALWELAI